MKILFLHLSDAHFREDTALYNIKINAMVNSLCQVSEFDQCVLVFSGDVVFSGEKNQYKVAENFIGQLIKKIKERKLGDKKIHTLITPGNHDNLSANPDRNIEELKRYYTINNIDEKFYHELAQLENFYTFANRNSCFIKGKVVDIRKLTFENFTLKVNLINTSPFSLLCEANEDKGLHYMPQREIDKLDFERQENYTISIIHHSPEWFSDNSKQSLYNKLYENSDLIFLGHEHFSLSETKIVNNKSKVDISNGLALYGTNTDKGFNTLVLDTKKCTLTGYKHVYNGTIYKPSKNLSNENVVFRGKNKFAYTAEFTNFLETDIDERNGEKYLPYFVFPTLEEKGIKNNIKNYCISTETKFLEMLISKNKISIEGGSRSGKTILARYLCRLLKENYVPIFLEEENFSIKDNNKLIKYAFYNQYGDYADMDEFWQLDPRERVLIVDGYDKVVKNKWNKFMKESGEKFGHIIIFGGVNWNFNIQEKTLEELSDNEVLHLNICPFYYVKREQLIQKICSSFQDRKIENVIEKAKEINEEITNQIRYFQLNPDFIHQYVIYYLNFSYMKTQKESNVFSKVFEANLTFRLAKHAGEENVDEIMVALDFIAHYIHFNKKYPLTFEEFENIIENYNKEHDNNLKPKFVYDVALKSNIIRNVTDRFSIEFCDENLLAYFTALHLNRKFNGGEGKEELKSILDNICFQPNGDIVLFLSYITSNIQILNPIAESLIKHMEDWDELSIDTNNVSYLSKVKVTTKSQLPSAEDKKEFKEQKSNIEKQIIEQNIHDSESLYSYDETKVNSFGNKLTKGISYLELIAKILPNFRHILKGEQKQTVINLLYQYPNRLLYFMLKDIDTNHERIISLILENEPRTKKGSLITKDMIIRELQNQSIAYILSLYDFIASTSVNGKTIYDLNKFNYKDNTTYLIQNIMMEESANNFKRMVSKAEELFKVTNSDMVKQMLILIVRKYFLYHDIPLIGEAQHVVDVFFGQDNEMKKAIKMARLKNKIIKK